MSQTSQTPSLQGTSPRPSHPTGSTEKSVSSEPGTSQPKEKKQTDLLWQPPWDPVEAQEQLSQLDRLDETLIVDELRGRIVDRLFHEIDGRGQLSWPGVKWFALKQGHLTIDQVQLNETEDHYRATAWARDKVRDVRLMGAAQQSKWLTRRDGSKVLDEFSLPKAVSKAQRNALRALLPETLIAEAYVAWKNRDKVMASPKPAQESRTPVKAAQHAAAVPPGPEAQPATWTDTS